MLLGARKASSVFYTIQDGGIGVSLIVSAYFQHYARFCRMAS